MPLCSRPSVLTMPSRRSSARSAPCRARTPRASSGSCRSTPAITLENGCLAERAGVEQGGEQCRGPLAPVRGLAALAARPGGADHGVGDENGLVPGCSPGRAATTRHARHPARPAPSRSGRTASRAQAGTVSPRYRRGDRPWSRSAITGPQAAMMFGTTTAAVFPERGGPRTSTPCSGRANWGVTGWASEQPR